MGKQGGRHILTAALLLVLAPGVVIADKRYAVLVGVGQYPWLSEAHQLTGPVNDVQLLGKYLDDVENFPESSIVRLTDADSDKPLRDNIIGALSRLEESVADGDFVLLYFSGHGSRQPASDSAEELDGYDEIFLSRDVRGWDKTIGAVENAITDDEIGNFISSYRQKGADVWAIFDSCHSGTMTRGFGDESVRTRKVADHELGIPEPTDVDVFKPRARGRGTPDFFDGESVDAQGDLITFSAAHSTEETPEMPLPNRDSSVYGLFTYAMIEALKRRPDASYGELAELILAFYSARPYHKSKPQFHGTSMDRQVFGRTGTRATVFPAVLDKVNLSRATVQAGTLRGFDVGARVGVFRDASEETPSAIGSVIGATITESVVEVQWASEGEVPSRHRRSVYTRLLQPAFSPTVLFSSVATRRKQDNRRLVEVIEGLRDRVPLAEFIDYDPDADFHIAYFEDKLWLLQRGQSLPCHVRPVSAAKRRMCERTRESESLFFETPENALGLLTRAVRARNLVKLQEVSSLPGNLFVEVEIERGLGNYLSFHGDRDEHGGIFFPGDKLYVSIENQRGVPWDFHLFYVDSQFGVSPLVLPQQNARVDKGAKLSRMYVGEFTADTVGHENLVVIVEPGRDGLQSDYSFLAQDRVQTLQSRGDDAGKGAMGRSGLQTVLEAVWNGDQRLASRGVTPIANTDQASVRVFSWIVQ